MAEMAVQRRDIPAGPSATDVGFDVSQSDCRKQRNSCVQEIGATRSISMMDILMLALAFCFFALAIGYTYACERL